MLASLLRYLLPQPSVDDWLNMLGRTKGNGWHVNSRGLIRDAEERCPIVAIVASIDARAATVRIGGEQYGMTTQFSQALIQLGYSLTVDVELIVRAADNDPCMPMLRARMLEVLGLSRAQQAIARARAKAKAGVDVAECHA